MYKIYKYKCKERENTLACKTFIATKYNNILHNQNEKAHR